jgi:hypothetical protein
MEEWWLKLNYSRLSLTFIMMITAYFGYSIKHVWYIFFIPIIVLVAFITDNLFK